MSITSRVGNPLVSFRPVWRFIFICAALLGFASAHAQPAPPGFSKQFMPDTIGPDSVSMLVFTINNAESLVPADNLAFTDTLPGDVTLAAPAFVSNSCAGTVTAPDGGSTISLSGGKVGAGAVCTIIVNVTAVAVDASDTTYTNTSGDLTSTLGNSGTASDDLMVDVDLPGFSKSFAPTNVVFGGRSTLTFTIDNSLNASSVLNLDFTDILPAGMVVANPANALTTCGTATIPPTLAAAPGSNTIVLDSNGTLAFPAVGAGATCTVTVDVIGGNVGRLGNVSGNLLAGFVEAGKATALLEVSGFENLLELSKEFTDDPVPPGGTVTLEFTVTNRSRTDAASGITFSDNLGATLAGLAPSGPLPTAPCGVGSNLAFNTGVLTLSGGSLAPEASCTFNVELSVPAGATPGTYPNTAGPVSGTVGGSPEIGNTAGDLLFVVSFPVLTKEFTDDPVGAGGTVTLEFTMTNPEVASTMSNIAFVDELTDGGPGTGFLPFPVAVTLPPTPDPPCGAGSSLALVGLGTDRQGLQLTGGSLAASDGSPGGTDTCTFSVTLAIPDGFPAGTYTNTTEPPTAVLDDFAGPPTVTGKPASGDVVVVGAPTLTKAFTDDPVPPGGTVTLELTLTHDDLATADATAIAFTDDLTTVVAGLTAASVDFNTCTGATVDISTSTLISFSGGTLTPGESCTVSLSLSVSGGAPSGLFTNTTSDVTATVGGVAVTGTGAEDDVLITGLLFSKAFDPNPVIAGNTATLTFTLDNTAGTADTTGISFSDDLSAVLPGLAATLPPTPDPPCGTGSSLFELPGGTFSLTGGSVTAGSSCTFSVPVTVPPGTPDDTYLNTTSSLVTSIGTLPPAVDFLTVESNILSLTKAFTNDPVFPGGTVTLELTLENLSATETVTDIAFDDDLDAALNGLEATGATTNTCSGMASSGFPTGLFQYAGGTLAPGATCSIVLTVDVPLAPLPGSVFPNTTTGVTGKVGLLDVFGDPASDNLEIQTVTFTKSFGGPTTATGSAVLTFTIENLDSVNALNGLAFSDDLDSVLPGLVASGLPTAPCGPGSVLAGASFLTLTNASVAPSGTCTFNVTVNVPATATGGTFLNTTSGLFSAGIPVAEPATAFLDIEPPPTFSKLFAPGFIGVGQTSTLMFTIGNSASTVAASGLAFTDNLPAGVAVAATPALSNTCSGTVTASPSATTISLSGGTVGAGASCSISVNITASSAGTFLNTTGDLTSSSGNSGTASATLTANPQPGFSKSFTPDTITLGGVSTLILNIDNTASTVNATGLGFTDNLPPNVFIATPSNAATDCRGGTLTAPSGGSTVSYSGGSVTVGASCSVSLDVTSSIPGVHVNTSGELTSSLGNSGSASATLTVNPPPTFSKAFAPATIVAGETSVLSFSIDNSASTLAANNLAFSDTLPTGLFVVNPANASNTCSGTLTADAGTNLISLSGGSVGAGASCAISVEATSSVAGTYTNTTDNLTSSLGDSGAASADLIVNANAVPLFSKVFSPATIAAGETSVLSFAIDNSGSILPADALAFIDDLPADVLIADPANASNTCGGTLMAVAGSNTINLNGGSVAAGANCAISVEVTSSVAGTHTNTAGNLTSSLGDSGTASADLIVNANPVPSFSKAFTPVSIVAGETSTLSFAIDNSNSILSADALAFTDDLPADVLIADPSNASNTCGGVLTADAGSGVVNLSGGSVASNASCTISVDVTSSVAGTHTNTTSNLTSSLGDSGTATAELTVTPATAPIFSKQFSPDILVLEEPIELIFSIDNNASTVSANDLAFTDIFPANMVIADPAEATNTCGGLLEATPGEDRLSLTGGSVAAGSGCNISVKVRVLSAGNYQNTTENLSSNLGDSGQARAELTVLSAVIISKLFTDDPVPAGGQVTLEYTLNNPNAGFAATNIAFADDFDAVIPGLAAVDILKVSAAGVCGAGSSVDANGSLSFTGGSLEPSSSCSFAVLLTVPLDAQAGTYPSATGPVSATVNDITIQNDIAATDDLVVVPVTPIPTLTHWIVLLLGLLLIAFASTPSRRKHAK